MIALDKVRIPNEVVVNLFPYTLLGLQLQSRKMNDKEKSLINSKDNVDREDNVIPIIVVSSYLESGEILTGGSGNVSTEKDNVTETSDLKTSKSVLHDKSELKKVKLSRANRAKKESKSKSSVQSWQKTFVKKQSERQIKRDKVLSRLIKTSVEANNSPKKSAIPKKTPNLESKTKTPNPEPKTKTNSPASQKPSEAVPPRIKADINDVKKEHVESEKDGKIKKIEKSKEESPKRIKGVQDKPDENREKDVKLKKDGDKKVKEDPIKAKLAEILKKQKEKMEVRNAPSKRHLKVPRGKVISKKSTETTMETKRLQKDEDSTEIREEHVSSHDSFKKRQQYGDDLRKRIRKKSNLDESNTRVVFNQTFGRRKESVNNIQTLVKEEKKAKRQVSFSSSGLPKYSSSLAHFDQDNSFARFHESSNVSSMKSGKVGEKLSAVVKPMPSRNATTSQSAGMENQRHRVIRSPTFTKEAPEVLQFNRNRHTGIQRHLGKDDYRQNARLLDSKLKYKPHIHRRSDTNESVHLYTEVNVPVKREYQRNFDSFVLLDKNFEDAENIGENSTPEQTIYKTQRRWTQNTIETKSVPEISSRKSSRKLSLKSETNSKYSTTPMLEIVFQPDKGDVYVSESKEQTKVYIKSGKVSAFLHRSPSAPTDVPSGEKDIVRRSKVFLKVVTLKTDINFGEKKYSQFRKKWKIISSNLTYLG